MITIVVCDLLPASLVWVGTWAGASRCSGLTDLHQGGISMHMRTTLNWDDALLERARKLTGIEEKTALLHAGLEALLERASARRLAALGGTERALGPIRRRRPVSRA